MRIVGENHAVLLFFVFPILALLLDRRSLQMYHQFVELGLKFALELLKALLVELSHRFDRAFPVTLLILNVLIVDRDVEQIEQVVL